MTKPDDLVNSVYRGDSDGIYPGLTKREYFAAMAMQGMIKEIYKYLPPSKNCHQFEVVAKAATFMADALINELNIPPR